MIRYILIQNFATIENIQIELEDGLNIITGETGAGKSIVIEAISLALGARADSSFVRTGTKKAIIQLIAEIDDEEYIITREISSTGKNICKINNRLATLSEISTLVEKLADIHGQYDNRLLMNNKSHLNLVDNYGDDEINSAKKAFESSYYDYKKSKKELDKLLEDDKNNRQKEDYLRFEISEIEKAKLNPKEDENLPERISIMENSEKIYSAIEKSNMLLMDGEVNILSSLGHLTECLSSVSNYSSDIADMATVAGDIYYSLEEISNKLHTIKEEISFNPAEIDQLISRLDNIENLKKKYGNSIEEILAYKEKISEEILRIDNFDTLKEDLLKKAKEDISRLKKYANSLTKLREKYALQLSEAIEKEMQDLNFPDAKFKIEISSSPAINSSGADQAEILISTNKGEPLKPLIKTASGGEISRIMLAIKSVTGNHDMIPTMIFDEIDSGISGITASAVGKKLRQVSKNHQVICITHLPQIAACGDYNYKIFKESNENETFTQIQKLDQKESIYEIARLLGGEIITNITRESAKELIENSKK